MFGVKILSSVATYRNDPIMDIAIKLRTRPPVR